ncbi:MAG: RagB/SusD family nutrient uptake outer membrane protein [Breznakibacter sp.]
MNRLIIALLFVSVAMSGCDDLFSPAIENNLGIDNATDNANYAHGLLLNGYARIPTNSWSFNDVATDDAVSNDNSSSYLKMATGQWTSDNNPLSQWTNSKAAIQYLNLFLSVTDTVTYTSDEVVNEMFNDRLKGEAYGLRALFMYYLLQNHAGWTEGGELLGVPILLEPEVTESDFNKARDSFEDCMQQIYDDLDKAADLLPLDFEDITNVSQIPAKYSGVTVSNYNRVFGAYFRLRVTARIAGAIRAQAALLAASPAYRDGNTTTWENAAGYAADVLDRIGGTSGLSSTGLTWYSNASEISGLSAGSNPSEILWRSDNGESNDLEEQNFPPTLYGDGEINPTQNLVDAFPMSNGYPITDASSGYNASDPYTGRDPRLKLYVLVNGSTAGVSSTAIYTSVDGGTNDGLNKVESSTRTGYYLRKLLRQDVNLNPSTTTEQLHYKARIRYTEIYLIYAEAANEAWGPTGTGGNGYSAYDVVKAIRQRAGVGTANNDAYLESVKGDQDKMRELIRNERRLELCFEGFRFWDLRRWESGLNETARGISISGGSYQTISVENRVYQSYMNHGPVPYSEVLKFSALEQNKGW